MRVPARAYAFARKHSVAVINRAAVFIGDTIKVTTTIAEKKEDPKRPEHGFVHERGEVVNQHDETVLAFTHIYLVEKTRQAEG